MSLDKAPVENADLFLKSLSLNAERHKAGAHESWNALTFNATSVRIVRHVQVKSDVNPYDPRWTAYLAQRSRRSAPAVSRFEAFAKA
jgi:hypothetical protein